MFRDLKINFFSRCCLILLSCTYKRYVSVILIYNIHIQNSLKLKEGICLYFFVSRYRCL